MKPATRPLLGGLAALLWTTLTFTAEPPMATDAWPQFRGPNCSGRSASGAKLPAGIGPDKHVVWKSELPPGHSSPAVFGDRVYVTAAKERKLLTIALDRATGKVLWEVEAPHERLEQIHRIGSHAQPSPATDGERVVSFFGSCGLFCYDTKGKLLWQRPMGPFKNDFGAGSSPIIVEDRVILCQDHDEDSHLIALDKRTGDTVWKTERPDIARNFCTPVIWNSGGKKQVVVAGTLRVAGYDYATGKEVWTVRGISRTVCMTPVVGDDGNLYVAAWSAGGDPGERISVEEFDKVAPDLDKNKNGTLECAELPDGAIKQRFSQVDRDKSGGISKAEYEYFRTLFDKSQNVVLAIRPGCEGEATDSHVIWEHHRHVPFCSSPLYAKGHVFTVKDGGILTCLNAETGKPAKQARLPGGGNYYASAVTGDGKIYLLNESGRLTVVTAAPEWEVLATADFGDNTYATPAVAGGRIYLRTARYLYCFGMARE